jgi:hypothetical protein
MTLIFGEMILAYREQLFSSEFVGDPRSKPSHARPTQATAEMPQAKVSYFTEFT